MLVALVTSSQKGSEVRPGPSKTSKMEIFEENPPQLLSCEISEIFNNICFGKQLRCQTKMLYFTVTQGDNGIGID